MDKENLDNIDKEIEELMQTDAPKKKKGLIGNIKLKKFGNKRLFVIIAFVIMVFFILKIVGGGNKNVLSVSAGKLEKNILLRHLA